MKTRSNRTSLFAAAALGAAVLVGSALPSLAQTNTPQPQATVQAGQPATAGPGNWYGPTMWWTTASNLPAPAQTTGQRSTLWGCWGGWW